MERLNIGSVYANHNEFKEALDQYSKETFTTWVTSRSKTIAKRNQEMRAKTKTENVKPLDEAIGLYFANYQCKHAGEVRRTGKGIRRNQSTYKKACPAKMYLAYSGKEKGLVLKDLQEDHNHDLSRVSYMQHPEQRCLSGKKLEKVATLIENGVTVHDIKEYLRTKEDHILTAKDVHNLAQKLKSDKRQDRSEEQMLIDKLHNLRRTDSSKGSCRQAPGTDLQVPSNPSPCRHFLGRKLHAQDKPVISKGDIDVKSECVVPLKRPPPMDLQNTSKRAKFSQRPQTQGDKFEAVMHVAISIADIASGLDTIQFGETLDTLHQFFEILNSGARVGIMPSLKDTLSEEDPAQRTENPGPAQHMENPGPALHTENPGPAQLL